jgi:hypothetical protein
MQWWTRTQRIRTVAEVPVQVTLLDAEAAPVYQQIGPKALHLRQLGLLRTDIARRLNVDPKTVSKAIHWVIMTRR